MAVADRSHLVGNPEIQPDTTGGPCLSKKTCTVVLDGITEVPFLITLADKWNDVAIKP
jgi:hypothetical protein